MEGVTSGSRPGQEHPEKPGGSHRECEIDSKGNLRAGAEGEGRHHRERCRKIPDTRERSHSKGAVSRHGPMAKSSRHSRWRSPDGSLHSRHKVNGSPAGKVRAPLSPAQGRRAQKPHSTRAGHQDRPGLARPPTPLKRKRAAPRSPAKTTGSRCRQDSPARTRASPKRRRQHLHPEASEPQAFPVSRLFDQIGALEVGLEELRAPGGAFLPVPASGTQIDASQRAWLTWQLAHTGATLHWALAQLDTLLALQHGAPAGSSQLAAGALTQSLLPDSQSGYRAPNSWCEDARRPASSLQGD